MLVFDIQQNTAPRNLARGGAVYSYYGAPEKNQKGKKKTRIAWGKMWALAPLCSARILIIYYFFPNEISRR